MKSLTKTLQQVPFYPLLFGLYSVLFLWAANFNQVQPAMILRSLIVSMTITMVVFLLSLLILRRLQTAAALAGLFLVLFYTYGHVYDLVEYLTIFGHNVGRHRFLLPLWFVLFVAGVLWILRSKSDFRSLTSLLNLVGSFLVVVTLVQAGADTLQANQLNAQVSKQAGQAPGVAQVVSPASDNTPDVYYFLLDGYNRLDLMKQDMHLDNTQFVSDLENTGFVFPDCTQSNYTATVTSMAATLNLNYITTLGVPNSIVANNNLRGFTTYLKPFTLNNLVMRQFKQMGYKIITFKTGFPFLEFPGSDIVYDYQKATSPLNRLEAYNFEYIFFNTTLMRVVVDESEFSPDSFNNVPGPLLEFINPKYNQYNDYFYQVYLKNLYNLNVLDSIAKVPGKKFVYAHLLTTHVPYTFTTDGKIRNGDTDTVKGYADQVVYLNKRMETIIKNILAESSTPPVIILQGDHGRAGDAEKNSETFEILNAYYLPQNGKAKLYPNITPVNTFRLIFSEYFNQNYPPLPDQSIWIYAGFPDSYKVAPVKCIH